MDAFGVVTFISATTATFCRKVKGKMLPEFAGCLVMKIPKAQNSALLQLLSADGNSAGADISNMRPKHFDDLIDIF